VEVQVLGVGGGIHQHGVPGGGGVERGLDGRVGAGDAQLGGEGRLWCQRQEGREGARAGDERGALSVRPGKQGIRLPNVVMLSLP
jgi:hypothetical protein